MIAKTMLEVSQLLDNFLSLRWHAGFFWAGAKRVVVEKEKWHFPGPGNAIFCLAFLWEWEM